MVDSSDKQQGSESKGIEKISREKSWLVLIMLTICILSGLGVFARSGSEWYGFLRLLGIPAMGGCVLLYLEALKEEIIHALGQQREDAA